MLAITSIQKLLSRVPSTMFLAIAVLIFAGSNSFTRIVVDIGEHNLIEGRNPISLCNVLFVGNICALGLMIPIFYRDWSPNVLKALTRKNWIDLTIISIFTGAIVPALAFTAIGNTNIANVVLIGRIEPVLTLILSVWFLGLRVDGWTIAGSLASFSGVVVALLLAESGKTMAMAGVKIGMGEFLIALAAIISSISTISTKLQLQSIPLGIFTIYRNILGTIIFFITANILYGAEHFIDAFSPLLWRLMIFYSLVIVVIGRLCWLVGLQKASPTELNLANLLNPIITIFMAYLILGQVPTSAQYWGLSLLILGVILSFIGNLHQERIKRMAAKPVDIEKMDMAIGFRGV